MGTTTSPAHLRTVSEKQDRRPYFPDAVVRPCPIVVGPRPFFVEPRSVVSAAPLVLAVQGFLKHGRTYKMRACFQQPHSQTRQIHESHSFGFQMCIKYDTKHPTTKKKHYTKNMPGMFPITSYLNQISFRISRVVPHAMRSYVRLSSLG